MRDGRRKCYEYLTTSPGGLCSDRQSGGGGSLSSKGKREGVYKVKHVVVRRDCFPG